MIRRVVFYSGHVQGVGFRYTTERLAKRFEVAGYVRNLDDGRVRLDVQGDPEQVDGLIAEIGRALARYIENKDITDYPPDDSMRRPGEPDAFTVRY